MPVIGENNYSNSYANAYENLYVSKRNESNVSKQTKDSTGTKESNVTTSTVELKTSTAGVTKTEQIKTGYSNVNDYSKYLQGKYSYMNTGTISMQGVPQRYPFQVHFCRSV